MADLLKTLQQVEAEQVGEVQKLCEDYMTQFMAEGLKRAAPIIADIEKSMIGSMGPLAEAVPQLKDHVHRAAVEHVAKMLEAEAKKTLKAVFEKNNRKVTFDGQS